MPLKRGSSQTTWFFTRPLEPIPGILYVTKRLLPKSRHREIEDLGRPSGFTQKGDVALKGVSHLGGLALWEYLMEYYVFTVRNGGKSIPLDVHRRRWRSPCKHRYRFVRAVGGTKQGSCFLAVYKRKGRSTSEDTGKSGTEIFDILWAFPGITSYLEYEWEEPLTPHQERKP